MKLEGLLETISYTILQGNLNQNVRSIQHDSRLIEEGTMFLCIEGFESDGHDYIDKAIEKGASVIVVTRDVYVEDSQVTIIRVNDARETLALIATKYYNRPTSQFGLIGVTGTNGKTSTVFLIERILKKANKKTGIIGTIENRIGDLVVPTERTTPDALELQQLFSRMVEANVNDVVMEVSSHALDLKRVHGAEFDVAVFTNLTLDHLDYHKTMEAYKDAKLMLFKMATTGVINIDDEAGLYMIEKSQQKRVLTYSTKDSTSDLFADHIHIDIKGTHFKLVYKNTSYDVDIQTPGLFSVYNALAAIGATIARGISVETAVVALRENSIVEGRFEVIESKDGFHAIVDYAHAPDGLENVLKTIKEFVIGRIITVFGCGGDRDKSKRPIMGEIAARYSDHTIMTSDNPRTEDPEMILDDIEVGLKGLDKSYERITDRVEAIHKAIRMAQPHDVILVAGKGHENYQIIGKTKYHMDDKEIVRDYIQEV